MKILIIGGRGTIGKKVSERLSFKHEVLTAGRTSGDLRVDIGDSRSIGKMFEASGKIDALVCVAGQAKWEKFEKMSEEDYYIGIRSKMMGQVNLVRMGCDFINDGGSITLTTGILADEPVLHTTGAALVNGAIHSFVRAAHQELPRSIRLNVVVPGLVEDSEEALGDLLPGYNPVSMDRVVNGYVRSVEGGLTGQVIRVFV